MYQLNNLFIIFFLLPYILCHVNQNFIKRQNDVMKEFFFICVLLIVIGFVIGPILLIIILPFIVDPIIDDNDEESINSSDENHRKERDSKIDSDDSLSLTDNEQENIDEQDIEETASF